MADRSNRVLAIIASFTLVAIALAAFMISTGKERTLTAGSPEAVIQSYLKNIIDKKNDRAALLFAQDSTCTAADLDRSFFDDNFRASLISTEVTNNRAYVKVNLTFSSGGPFDSGYSEKQSYRLDKEDGQWRIAGIPWPLYDCGVSKK
jgi:hypothetical protein